MSSAPDPDTIYQNKGGSKQPRAIFLYYLPTDKNKDTKVYFIERDTAITDIQLEVEKIVNEIELSQIECISKGPKDVNWTRYSFIVFVLKKDKFIPGGAVTFKHYSNGHNHSFFNGRDLMDFKDYSAVCCTNVRLNIRGLPLGNEREHFRWETYHSEDKDAAEDLRLKSAPIELVIDSHNDSGTNTGP